MKNMAKIEIVLHDPYSNALCGPNTSWFARESICHYIFRPCVEIITLSSTNKTYNNQGWKKQRPVISKDSRTFSPSSDS